ncbi:glutathione hydrolase 1 proenzyme isoform X2 [Nematostella vectensis]|uniref:glutathione hydrolase 1 proenzyme isoform X2 n=1 Tax=Nematostella vectensis TaxID=45351 RepID=UPI0020775BB5|nr:glutathione hydrolase 1 proenzyme isoform X2 [Nematostella vectensis]
MKLKDRRIVIAVLVIALLAAIGIGIGIGYAAKSSKSSKSSSTSSSTTHGPTPVPATPSSPPRPTPGPGSGYGPYASGAVATDAGMCSEIGRDILKKQGSAVDAAIASSFCIGVINMHSAGVGGGGFMLVYDKSSDVSETMDYREEAPSGASQDMFKNKSSLVGGLATGVPGEVKGLYEAYRKYGKLQWRELLQPSIDLASKGFPLPLPVYEAMVSGEEALRADPGLRQLLFNGDKLKRLGEKMTNPQLAVTLEKIRDDPHSFYNGCLANDIVRDVKKAGGIITLKDLAAYSPKWKKALASDVGDLNMYTTPPPSSGAVITMILNILRGYNMTAADRSSDAQSALTYHRIIESFKYAYAWRAKLGDPDFSDAAYANINKVVENMTDPSFAERIRQRILDDKTFFNMDHYGQYYAGTGPEGTSHLSVLAPNGDAVSLTTTVNWRFGAKYRSPATGIIYNNQMDDFSTPGQPNGFGVAPSPSNYIRPGKRPMSSISPVIFTKNGTVYLIAGASGGTRITTATALVVMNKLWFGRELNDAVSDPRVHNQMSNTTYETKEKQYTLPQTIRDGLIARGNQLKGYHGFAVVQAIEKRNTPGKSIYAQSDPRKYAWAAGL